MERTRLRRWAVERRVIFWSSYIYVNVSRDFVVVVSHILLDGAKGSHNHRDRCCFEPPHSPAQARSILISKSLYLLSFSVVETEVLLSRGTVMSTRRQVLSFLFFSTISGL